MTTHREEHRIWVTTQAPGAQLVCGCGWTIRINRLLLDTLLSKANKHRWDTSHNDDPDIDPYMAPLETPDYER